MPDAASGYALDSGDRLRIVVFGQDGLSNTYVVDAAGNITVDTTQWPGGMPAIASVPPTEKPAAADPPSR